MKPFLQRACSFLGHSWTHYTLAWCAALGMASGSLYLAWFEFAEPGRRDGNFGHVGIDFAGQWLMGRMLQQGHGRHLYVRSQQRSVLQQAYLREDQNPGFKDWSDADYLMSVMVGRDTEEASESFERWEKGPVAGIGGPLYPPLNAFVMYPLALFPPQKGYRIYQVVQILFVFACGLAARHLSRGRVWWPVASVFILVFPGFQASISLGQNAALSLTILMWGWLLAARGQPVAAGAVWGLLAFKPLWAAAFFPVLLLTRRWRMALTMLSMGTLLALLTVPFVGWHSWRHWLQVGHEAALLYNLDYNWIFLSRDLLSTPRRWLLDFTASGGKLVPHPQLTVAIGWGSVLLVIELTAFLALTRKDRAARAVDGHPAAFLFLAGWLTCLHFMYYDVLLAAMPVFLLLTEPRRYLVPRILVILPLGGADRGDGLADYYRPILPASYPPPLSLPLPSCRHIWVFNSLELYLLLILLLIVPVHALLGWKTIHWAPWETFCLFALWLWCGWRWFQEKNEGMAYSAKSDPGATRVADAPGGRDEPGERDTLRSRSSPNSSICWDRSARPSGSDPAPRRERGG